MKHLNKIVINIQNAKWMCSTLIKWADWESEHNKRNSELCMLNVFIVSTIDFAVFYCSILMCLLFSTLRDEKDAFFLSMILIKRPLRLQFCIWKCDLINSIENKWGKQHIPTASIVSIASNEISSVVSMKWNIEKACKISVRSESILHIKIPGNTITNCNDKIITKNTKYTRLKSVNNSFEFYWFIRFLGGKHSTVLLLDYNVCIRPHR